MSESLVSAHGLSVGYQHRPVLRDLSLRLERGTFTFILGANGSGKSTLLKTLAGVLKPVEGEVKWGSGSARLGYVPQRHTIDPLFLLSALDVVLMGASADLRPGALLTRQQKERALSLLTTAAGDVANREFAKLSGGQQQRVLIARGLMTNPDLLLLDEPTAGVDSTSATSILNWLRELNASGLTILLVTHHLSEIRKFASDLLWLGHGRLQQGTIQDLLAPGKLEEILLG